jgi:hypothetical protein
LVSTVVVVTGIVVVAGDGRLVEDDVSVES